jgi:hypothetical protein
MNSSYRDDQLRRSCKHGQRLVGPGGLVRIRLIVGFGQVRVGAACIQRLSRIHSPVVKHRLIRCAGDINIRGLTAGHVENFAIFSLQKTRIGTRLGHLLEFVDRLVCKIYTHAAIVPAPVTMDDR